MGRLKKLQVAREELTDHSGSSVNSYPCASVTSVRDLIKRGIEKIEKDWEQWTMGNGQWTMDNGLKIPK